MPLPDGASFEEGASFLLTFLTAWIPLTRQVRVARRRDRAGARRRGRRRLGGDPGREAPGRARRRDRALGGEAGASALELGADEALAVRGVRGAGARPTSCSTRSAARCSRAALAMLNPLGAVVALGFAGGWWEPLDPAPLVGRNLGIFGFYLGRLMRFRPDVVARRDRGDRRALGVRRGEAARRRDVLAGRRRGRAPARRGTSQRGQGCPRSVARSSRAGARGSAPRSSLRSSATESSCARSTSRTASTPPTRKRGRRSTASTSRA